MTLGHDSSSLIPGSVLAEQKPNSDAEFRRMIESMLLHDSPKNSIVYLFARLI